LGIRSDRRWHMGSVVDEFHGGFHNVARRRFNLGCLAVL
jgi:hypothetical protein